jgi:hypothetical protein
MDCGWCARPGRMLAMTISFAVDGAPHTLQHPVVCDTCEVLVFGEEGDENGCELLAETRLFVLRLAAGNRKRRKQADACCWCSRTAAPVELEWEDASFDDLRLSNPTFCSACLGLIGLTPFGFAVADQEQWEARLKVFAALSDTAETATEPEIAPARQRADELILVKLALLERDSHDFQSGDFDGYHDLAHSLGLASVEAEAEVARLLRSPESPLCLRAVDGALVPRLSSHGWLRVRALQKLYASGLRHRPPALRSTSLRRALDQLATDAVEAA